MMCVQDKAQYNLEGDFYSSDFRYLEVRVYKCNGKTSKVPCKKKAEIDAYFEAKYFSFAFVNSYIDFLNFEQPIQNFIDDSLFFQVESDKEKKANLYVMKAEMEMQDSIFQLGQQDKKDFPSISNIRNYDDKVSGDDGPIVSVYIRYD